MRYQHRARNGPTLTDGVVVLRSLRQPDAAKNLAGEDEEQVRWLNGGVGSMATVIPWIARNQHHWLTGGPIRNFGIWDADTGTLLGNIEVNLDHETSPGIASGQANLAYGLFPEARCRGYASRAVSLACDYLRTIGIAAAVIRVDPDNHRSIAVAQRTGFCFTGVVATPEGERLERWVRNL